MAYKANDGVAMALLEAAIIVCGVGHVALVNDLYVGSPVPPANWDGALARLAPDDFGSLLFAMPFAFFIGWPLSALGATLARMMAGRARSWALIVAMVPMGVAGLALAVVVFGLTLDQPLQLLANGAIAGALLGTLARLFMWWEGSE